MPEDLHTPCPKAQAQGVKLYNRGMALRSTGLYTLIRQGVPTNIVEAAQKLGIKNIHVHKGTRPLFRLKTAMLSMWRH